jgi:16S rRNA processing protein RimM
LYDPDTLAIGVLGKPHGLRGEIVLRPYNGVGRVRPLSPADGDTVELVRDGQTMRKRLRSCRVLGENLVLAFEGPESPDAVRVFTHWEVRVARQALPALAPGEYFVEDVVGCDVLNSDGRRLGQASGTFWNGAHDVMTVALAEGEGGELLIPMVPAVMLAVDVAARVVRVAWEAGDDE